MLKAVDKKAHNGLPHWHRDLDKEIANYLDAHPDLTKEEFERYLRDRYSMPDLKDRFPDQSCFDDVFDPARVAE